MTPTQLAHLAELFNTLANTDSLSVTLTDEPNVLCLRDVHTIAEEGLQILDAIEGAK